MEEVKKEEIKKSVLHIASLTLGIISIVAALFWYISIPTGILAIVFGVKSVKRTGSKIAKAGVITGIVGLDLCALIYVFSIIMILLEVL